MVLRPPVKRAPLRRTGHHRRTRRAPRLPTGARAAWVEGIEHVMQLSAPAEAGLTDTADLAAVGWEPALLTAIKRAMGWGRPSKTKAV